MVFECNRDHLSGNSGVIYLSAFGQILLEASVDILFRNNTGRYIPIIIVCVLLGIRVTYITLD